MLPGHDETAPHRPLGLDEGRRVWVGIVIGLAISLPVWALVAWLIWLFVR